MPSGLLTLKQQLTANQKSAWSNPSYGSTYGAAFSGTGSGQYLTGPTTSALNFGTGNFTIEFWIFVYAYGASNLTIAVSASNAGQDFQIAFNAGSSYIYWHNSGVQIAANSASSFTPGRWSHIALVRSGTTVSLFADGVRYGTTTNSASINLTNFVVGAYWNSLTAYMVNGFVSNLRMTNTAVYDPTLTTLTLPTTALTAISGTQLLTLQNATIVDNSPNALTITNNGNVGMNVVWPFGGPQPYKTPAVDYLVVAGGGSGGYIAGGGGAGGLLNGNIPVVSGSALTVTIGAGGSAGSNGSNSVFGNVVSTGGGSGGSYANTQAGSGGSGGGGTSPDSSTGRAFNAGQAVFGQGNFGGASGYFNASNYNGGGGGGAGAPGLDAATGVAAGNGGQGAGSDIGGARTTYAGGGGGSSDSGGIAAPGGAGGGGAGGASRGSTGGTGTVNGANGTANTGGGGGGHAVGGSNSSGGSGIVVISYPDIYAPVTATTGGPTATTSGSGSIFFNSASSQTLIFNSNAAFQLGTGEFTWEAWINYNNTNSGIFDLGAINSSGSFGVFIQSPTIFVRIDGSSNDLSYSLPSGVLNTWFHIAVVRSGTTLTLYYNGTAVASGTRINNVTQSTPYIGYLNGLSAFYMLGNISNMRLVKGSAVYTSNFTPSTKPLTAVSGTSLLLNCNSGAHFADSSGNGFAANIASTGSWSQNSPFQTGLGYKNRVYTFTSSGTITF